LICCCDLQKTVPRERESLQLRANEDDFVAELLRAMGYETEDTVVRTQQNILLTMGGKMVFNKTDVCLLDVNSEIPLLVQEDKTHINPSDPEAQLIAKAIGAFQEDNAIMSFSWSR